MRCHVYDERGEVLLRVEDRTPLCGEDFCDRCGDCLHCYRDGCYVLGEWTVGAECLWIKYEPARSPGGHDHNDAGREVMASRCECCGGTNWFQCRCDETCETGARRIREGRDETDVEGDPEPARVPTDDGSAALAGSSGAGRKGKR